MSIKNWGRKLCALFLSVSLLLSYIPSPAYAMEFDDSPATDSSIHVEESKAEEVDTEISLADVGAVENENEPDQSPFLSEISDDEENDTTVVLFNAEQGESVEESYYPVITVQPEAESESMEYSEFGGAFLEVAAEAAGNGELSYKWYRVSSPEDEQLSDDYAMGEMCLAPINILGTNQFYCVVTNTVDGKDYSVKSDVVTIYVYKSYIAKLNLYKNEDQVLSGQGYWQGKEYNVEVDRVNTYKLEILPINKEMVGKYSMAISYNGEVGEVGSYQQELVLDTSKFPVGSDGYFTVQVGEYDSASERFTASEVYKFNVTRQPSLPIILKQPQAESDSMEYSEFGGAFLEVEAEATDNGELSYKWYKVNSPEDEELSDDYAMDSMCLAPLNTLGKVQYYCVVTNTVGGEEFSVKTDVVTIYVYKSYIAKLNLYENGNKILDGQGYWQGKEFNISVDSANTYKLEILPINKEMVGKYSMTISYNGEKGEVGAYKQNVELDISKFPVGDTGYLTVEVGEYDSASKSYLASEVYKFKVTKKLSLTSIAVTADEAEIAVDMSEANSTGKLKTTSAATADEIKLTVTANSESAKVYLGSSTTAFVSGSMVKLGDYETQTEGTKSYAVIPVKLEIPAINGQTAVTKSYTLWVEFESYYPVITLQPEPESETTEYEEFGGVFLEIEAEAKGNGELSYHWYRVSTPEDEELGDDYAMDSMCLAPKNILGTNQFYCIVTNTVNGKEYSVKSNVISFYVYKSYIAKLNLYENGNKILDGQGYWQGKEFNINVDSANTYKLEILPINKDMVGKYSMTISYNGEKGEVGAYKQNVELDTGKFPVGDTGYLTVEVGEYDSASKNYLASEVYKFKVTKKLSLTGIAVTADEAEIAVDMSEANSTGKLKTTSAVTADEIKLTVTANSESAKVYLGSSTTAFVSGSTVKLGDYETQTEGAKSYAVIPVKLEIPAINGQTAVTKSYTLWVEFESYYPVITLQPEPESETTEYEEFGGVFLEIEAEAKGNGELSYHWYRVSTPEDEELGDDYAMDSMCLAPKNILGTNQFYCIVTNTVNGKEYSVKSNVISFYVYKSYIAKLNLYENGNKILDGQGYWQGKEFNINVDSANTYKLEILPINKDMVGKYSMTISYNGEKGEVGAYKQNVELDTGKFPVGDTGYLTVEVGEYDSASKNYLASEVYKFKVTKKLSLTGIAVTADEAEIAVDMSEANSTGKLKTTSAVTADEIKLTVTANSESAKVYLGSSTTAFVSGSAVKLGDYETQIEGTQRYVAIPIKLEISATEGQPGVTKEYTLWVMTVDCYPIVTTQPQSVAMEKSPDEYAVLEVEATVTNGVLSYQWYKVGDPTDEKLEDDFSTMEMYAAPLDTIGSSEYYCIVTNTVDGKEYSVKTDIATVTVYKAYMNSLTIWANDRVVSDNRGDWNGGVFDIEINDRTDYRLNLLPLDVMGSASYSMTISYNGEAGVRTSFKSSVAIDSTKFPYGDTGYYVIEIGEYSTKTGTYTSSEVYRFNIHKYPGMKELSVSEGNKQIPLAIDLCAVPNMRAVKTKTTQAATSGAVTISVSPIQSATTVYIGNSGEAGLEATINLADYPVVYEDTYPYAVVPVKLVTANGTVRAYSVLVQIEESRIKISKQPASVTCYTGDQISLNVEAVSLDGGALSYQWYKGTQDDSELIPNANGASFAPKSDAVGEAAYYCVITDTKGETSYSVKSDVATVTAKDSSDFTPVILSQPESRIYCNQGDKITLSVEVLKPSKGELSYQWYKIAKEDQPVANAKDYVPSTDVNSSFGYYCVITNTVDGKEYKAKTNNVSVRANLTKCIHAAEVIGQPGTYVFDENTGMVPGGYTAIAKGNSAPKPFNVRFQYADYDVDSIVTLYHSTTNSYDGAELVKDAICKGKREGGVSGEYYKECEINPNTAYPAGEHYFYVVITLSPSDKNSTVEPVSTKSDILKIDFTDRETTMDGAGTEQNPYIIKTTEHLSEIQKMVADGDSFAGAYFQIANDVSLPTNWTPIGTRDTAFSGHIDGNHKKLTVPAGERPLLGCINGASVKDLDIYGEQIEGAGLVDDFTGVGLSGSAIVLDNVTLKSGSKTLKSGLVAAGAGNGYASASAGFVMTIRNCTIESNVVVGYTETESQIGSFAGRFQGTIENCTSSATVKGKNYVGGIIGTRDNAMAQCVVKNSTFHGTVESSGSYAGGIVGGGYDNSTAPNGACPTILACTVDGTVKGNERVGGIFGGDGFVAQTWDNVVGSISANSFTGKVSGSKYVGAIIGYRDSLNRYDNISANTYSAGCGADRGIGFVKYLDTSYANPTKMNGTIVFSTEGTTKNCPAVEGCAWRKDHNRTDDPLGKDADKLCKKIGGSSADPICYELTVSGSYKTEYNLGEELNLNGIKLTATWTNGTTSTLSLGDVTIEGYDKNTVGNQTISLSYGAAVTYITVTVKPVSTKITVSVTILGDTKHGNTKTPHGLARGGLTTWASESGVEADTSETVWDVLQRVAKKHNITFTASDNNAYHTVYISAVNGLGEFDNGKNSGWMYTVNGTHPEVGVAAKYLKNGDNIVLHYTDDYDYEEGGNKYGQKPSGGTTTGGGSTGGTTTGGTTGTTTGGTSMITTADRNKAAAVDKLIEKIGTVTKDSGPAIEAARKAYNDLTPTQKRLVNRLKELTDAEKAYAKLTATAEDQKKAQEVMDKIKKIGNVTKDSKQDIRDARKAYDALTDLQKLLVDNYDVLTAAETKFAMLDTLGKVSEPYISTGEYMEKLGTPNVGAIGGEWMVIGLARSGRTVHGVEDYYQKAVEYVQQSIDPDTGRLHKAKSTDNSRMILALTAIGKDVTNVGGYNLLAGLSDLEFVKYQGNNGPIWALLALDSGNYPVPSGGTTTRQALIDEILSVQTSDGGWAISGDRADSDMTGMALTALAPYYKKDPTVKQAIDKAIARLSEMQDDDGGFSTTYGDGKYIATSESTAQVLTALSALGIDADTDSRFIKNGSSVVDALLRYYVKGGGFKHIMDGEIDGMGTEQAYYALTAYYRFLSGKTNLYDMTDIIDMGGDVVTVEPTVPATTEPPQAAQTNIPWWIIAVCIFGGAGWGVVIGIVLVPKLSKKKD